MRRGAALLVVLAACGDASGENTVSPTGRGDANANADAAAGAGGPHASGAHDADAVDAPSGEDATSADAAPLADSDAIAPPSGDAATSPTTFFGASRCAASSFALCDGFEATPVGAVPPAPWSVATQNPGDFVRIDDTRAARGTRSVHVHTGNTGFERALLYETSTFPAKNNSFYGRAFVYFASALPQAHWTHIAGVGNLPGTSTRTEVRYGGQFTHLMANYFGHDQYQHAAQNVNAQWVDETKMPSSRWACFEWLFDGAHDGMRFWLDEAEIPRLHVDHVSADCCQNDPWTAPAYDRLQLGWEIYSNQDQAITSYDVWFDEIAVDSSRIGCAR